MHCRRFSSILDLYPPDAISTHLPIVTTKHVSRHCHVGPGLGVGGDTLPPNDNHCVGEIGLLPLL